MSRLLGAIAAGRHAAPASQAPPCVVGKDQGAAVSLARLDIGEVLVAHASGQRLSDRRQEGLGRSPSVHRFKLQASAAAVATLDDLTKPFLAGEKLVQRLEVVDRSRRQRAAHMLAYESPEPFAQGARLFSDFVQFAWRRLCGQRSQRARRNEVGLSEPCDETFAAVEPFNPRIDWRRHRIQEVEAERVGDEEGGLSVWRHGFSNQANSSTV